jgi:UDP-N-acetylmuramate--alanine ligase
MKIKNVYFIGIGGIGMSAIARYYNHAGAKVSGYDKTPSKITDALIEEGIEIHFAERVDLIPKETKETLVIYTPAIPNQMSELKYVQDNGYRLIKRSKALGEIASTQKCLAVAGTHGKTTTSTMLAHLLTSSGEGCNAFLGGISKNYHTNLLLSKSKILVAEADEFDRSFLQLFPEISLITSTDADHLDIYNDHKTMVEAFKEFGKQTKEALVVKKGLEGLFDTKAKIYTYSFDKGGDFYPTDIMLDQCGYFTFTLITPFGKIEGCKIGTPGWINVENGIGASAIAMLHGTSHEKIKQGLLSFQGVERRLDIHVNTPKHSYIDDYAHHPREIAAAIASIREIFPNRKLCAIFQPHLYTRTRDFYKDFAESLSALDEVILLPIYPARELPIQGIQSEIILDLITVKNKKIVDKEELMSELSRREIDIIITFGAGDIDRFIPKITQLVKDLK